MDSLSLLCMFRLPMCCTGTVRRFCEHFLDGVERIAFAVSSPSDEFIYLELLPLYFPRSVEEEIMAEKLLPDETGNEWGETVMEERKIRIAAGPGDSSPLIAPVTSTRTDPGMPDGPNICDAQHSHTTPSSLVRRLCRPGWLGICRLPYGVGFRSGRGFQHDACW